MSILLVVIHVIVCLALIMIVLLQTGKGADMGAAFGCGSSQTLFGSTGASTFLSKATTIAAIVLMLTSLQTFRSLNNLSTNIQYFLEKTGSAVAVAISASPPYEMGQTSSLSPSSQRQCIHPP